MAENRPLTSGRCPLHGIPKDEQGRCPSCVREEAERAVTGEASARIARALGIAALAVLSAGSLTYWVQAGLRERTIQQSMPDAMSRVQVHCYSNHGIHLSVDEQELSLEPELEPIRSWLGEHDVYAVFHDAEDGDWMRVIHRHPNAKKPICIANSVWVVKPLDVSGTEEAVNKAARDIAEEHGGFHPRTIPYSHPFFSWDGAIALVLCYAAGALVFLEALPLGRIAIVVALVLLTLLPIAFPSVGLAVVAKILLALLGIGWLVLLKVRGYIVN